MEMGLEVGHEGIAFMGLLDIGEDELLALREELAEQLGSSDEVDDLAFWYEMRELGDVANDFHAFSGGHGAAEDDVAPLG